MGKKQKKDNTNDASVFLMQWLKRATAAPGWLEDMEAHHAPHLVASCLMRALKAGQPGFNVVKVSGSQVASVFDVVVEEAKDFPDEHHKDEECKCRIDHGIPEAVVHQIFEELPLPINNMIIQFEDRDDFYFWSKGADEENTNMLFSFNRNKQTRGVHELMIFVISSHPLISQINFDLDYDDPEQHELAGRYICEIMWEMIALSRLLESANVDLIESEKQYPRGSVGEREKAIRYEIAIHQNKKRYRSGEDPGQSNYTHRFERRGNFAHHYEMTPEGTPNRIFAKWSIERPEKVVMHDGKPCVKIWRPPAIVGPSDKPFIPKARVVK